MEINDGFHSYKKLRCVLTIIMLIALLPLSILYVAIVTLFNTLNDIHKKKRNYQVTDSSKVVMVTGGKMSKSLHFARWFWKNGYKVVMVETDKYCYSGSRWSRAVTHFETVTCPRENPDEYMDGLVKIAEKYNVDFFVPVSSPVSSIPDSCVKPRLKELGCKVLHFDLEMTQILDDKHKFCDYAKKLGLKTPTTFCVSNDDEARKLNETLMFNNLNADKSVYVLKNIEYDPKHRLDLFKMPCNPNELDAYLYKIREDGNAITPEAPWQVQQFIAGSQEYTCFVVLRDGKIRAITTSESSCSQLNYEHIDIPYITKWVEEFANKTGITGQLCFDFMKDNSSGVYYPIECNPRVHSQCVTFLDTPEFGEAVLSNYWGNNKTLEPPNNSKPVFWFYNELFKAVLGSVFNYRKAHENNTEGLSKFISLIFKGRDSDFDVDDPLPFLMRNHCQLPYLLLDTLKKDTPWLKLDFCIGKVVELNGD